MLRVQYSKGTKEIKDDQKMIKILMGDEVAPKKIYYNNALDVVNLDI